MLQAVGLDEIDLQAAPTSLSDGYKRRLALAVQLVRAPSIATDCFGRAQCVLTRTKALPCISSSEHVRLQGCTCCIPRGLSSAQARGPSVLLLDEPLAGLDWRARSDIAELLGMPI